MQVDDKEYTRIIRQNAVYRSALKIISGFAMGAYLDIDGWIRMLKEVRKIAADALSEAA